MAKQFDVTVKGPKGELRRYLISAKDRAEARSLVEETERVAYRQRAEAGSDDVPPYKVASVKEA